MVRRWLLCDTTVCIDTFKDFLAILVRVAWIRENHTDPDPFQKTFTDPDPKRIRSILKDCYEISKIQILSKLGCAIVS